MALPEKASVGTGLTAEQLQEILKTVLSEARKPADPTEAELALKAQELADRKSQASLVLEQMANKKREQEACSHVRRDGSTTGVYVQDGNYIICQACQKVIRPETETGLFNRLLQLTQPAVF